MKLDFDSEELDKLADAVAERPATKVLKKAQTRFGLLEVTKDGAYSPERGVLFSKEELALIMDKELSRQRIDRIFRLKEVFEGEVIGYEGDSTGQ